MNCRYVKTIYQNKENGYCIFLYETEDNSVPEQVKSKQTGKSIRFTAIGNNLPDTDSIELNMQGNWVKSKYGPQFKVDTYEEILPQTIEGITGYLSSGLIKGIGPKIAEQIVDKFGLRTFDVFDQYPDNLLQIKGITEQKSKRIMDSYHGSHAIRDLAAYLTPFHVTPNKIQKIYEHFGCEALETVKKQPFMLCQISGFGFLTVDEIARSNRCRLNDPMRIEGCVHYCMELIAQEGHLYQQKEEIQKKVWEQLNHGYSAEVVSEAEISRELYRLVKEKVLYFDDGALYPAKLYQYECETAKNLAKLLVQETEDMSQIDALIAEAQRELGILLAAKQMEAVRKAFCHLISIITGGPGTGKTTVQKVILYVNQKLGGDRVLLTAPTGRASRRMSESTGYPDAKTMHSAMGLNGDQDSEIIYEQFEEKSILADEFTMSDMWLSWAFFGHIKKGTRLVLIGDVNQLPSVGPGSVLKDIIRSGEFPVVELTKIFRQASQSDIVVNAHKINQGIPVVLDNKSMDFFFLKRYDANVIISVVITLIQKKLPKFVDAQPYDIQVLTPMRKGLLGVERLNGILQQYLNPPEKEKKEKEHGNGLFREGDKVMQIKNNYQIEWEVRGLYGIPVEKGVGVFNGDTGILREINTFAETVTVEFDERKFVEYSFKQLDELELAYAITIHKAQGSEYPAVIIPLLGGPKMLMNRNLLYTAVTRARKCVTLVGDEKTFEEMENNRMEQSRYTTLDLRIKETY